MNAEFEVGLAATKLRTPMLPKNLVQRSRLDAVLDEGVDAHTRLLLVSAPAGSGKSTLVASWLGGRSGAAAWLQVEHGDDDPTRFWTYLIEAIGQADTSVRTAVMPIVVASKGDHDLVVPALVNALTALDDPLFVVIDDYHLISNDVVHRGMERLIELCPVGVTIAILARFDPPFRLGRLRVRKHLSEIRGELLRFEPAEAAGLLGSIDRPLSTSQVQLLSDRTEGWAAGLVLAGLSLGQSIDTAKFVEEFHGDDQMVVDYLSDEFLGGVQENHRQRLLATSILERLSGPLIDAVTQSTGGRQWLIETAASNQLVIGLDRTGDWYRYHHLLRDLLRLEATNAMPEDLPGLHRRAAAWFEEEGDYHRAFAHWLEAGDRHDAARAMLPYGSKLIADSQIETLRRALEALGDVASTDAACALLWGWCEFIAGNYSAAGDWVAVTHDVASNSFDQQITAPLRMNIFLGRGDVNSALVIARELAASETFQSLESAQTVVTGGVFMWAGMGDDARQALELAVKKARHTQFSSVHVLGLIYQAIVELDAGNTVAAGVAASLAIDTADKLGIAGYYRLGPAYAIRARTALNDTASDDADALENAMRAIEVVRRTTSDLAFAYVLTIGGDVLTELGDNRGPELLAEAREAIDRFPDPGIVARHLERIESRHAIAALAVEVPTMVEQLTERETAVLRYLPTALSQREIASELFVSPNTVKTHCGAIYRKLAVDNRKAAVQVARDLGIL